MHNLLLDNIIFSLQRSGGISVVWQEHISRLLKSHEFNCRFIEYEGARNNIFRKEINIPRELVSEMAATNLKYKRYLNVRGKQFDSPYIFHSSYYRIDNNHNAKNVTTVHDFNYEYFVKGIKQKVHSYQKGKAINKSDAVICISESTRNDLMKFYPKIDRNKIHVIHNGVNPVFRRIEKNEYGMSLPFDDGGFILYVGGHYAKYKNLDLAIEVCRSTKLPLIIAGGEQLNGKELSKLDENLGKSNFIHLYNLSTERLNELYNRALALLYPTLYEGFGIPVLEAQRACCPVIAFAVSSIPEVMGESDLLLREIGVNPVADAVRNLMNNVSLREKEIEKGLANSKLFSWDNTYSKTIEVYRSLL